MIPNQILAIDGETIVFNCSIQGSPIQRIQWIRNAKPLSISSFDDRIHLLDHDQILQIKQVRREDRGMFVSREYTNIFN